MFLFSTFSFFLQYFWTIGKRFLRIFRQLLRQIRVTSTGRTSGTHWLMTVSAFCNIVCEYDMSCAVEKIVVVEVSKYVESCSSTLKSLYLHYGNAYSHKACRMVAYLSLIMCPCKITWQIKTLYFHYNNDYGHQTW